MMVAGKVPADPNPAVHPLQSICNSLRSIPDPFAAARDPALCVQLDHVRREMDKLTLADVGLDARIDTIDRAYCMDVAVDPQQAFHLAVFMLPPGQVVMKYTPTACPLHLNGLSTAWLLLLYRFITSSAPITSNSLPSPLNHPAA